MVEDASLKLAHLPLSSNPRAIDFKNIISSRINLKQENDLIQILLNIQISKTGFLLIAEDGKETACKSVKEGGLK